MKLPEMPKRSPKAPSSGRGSVKAPGFLQDLYKDMRDRRLIIPAVVLLVAIVAVPVLLGSDPESSVNPPVVIEDPNAIAVEPAVLVTQEVGVREFDKRLDELRKKDPFGDKFVPSAAETAGAGALEEPDDGGIAVGDDGASTVTDVSGGGGDTSTTPTTVPQDPVQTEAFVLVPRIDVEVGIVDRDRRQTLENVEAGDLLPSKKTPTAMFLDISNNSEIARFLVSRDVDRVTGDAECKPGKNNCQFMDLNDGDRAYLSFADGNRYVILVKDIYHVRIPADEFKQQD